MNSSRTWSGLLITRMLWLRGPFYGQIAQPVGNAILRSVVRPRAGERYTRMYFQVGCAVWGVILYRRGEMKEADGLVCRRA